MPKERMMEGGLSSMDAIKVVKAYEGGKLSKKQYDNLPPKLLLGIVNSKNKKGGGKKPAKKPAKKPKKSGK